MLIIGTGGLAGDLLFSIQYEYSKDEIAFYNDVNEIIPEYIKSEFTLLTNEDEAKRYFETTDNRFLVAVGNNLVRHYIAAKFETLGGVNKSYVSKEARVGKYNTISDKGVIILADAHITNDIIIDEGVLFYLRAGIGHYSHLKPYSLLSGGFNSSSINIGAYSTVGINVGIKPTVSVGKYAFLGTGAVITKDVEDYSVMVGNPAKKISDSSSQVEQFLNSHPKFVPLK